jgi:hypothetical protein
MTGIGPVDIKVSKTRDQGRLLIQIQNLLHP